MDLAPLIFLWLAAPIVAISCGLGLIALGAYMLGLSILGGIFHVLAFIAASWALLALVIYVWFVWG